MSDTTPITVDSPLVQKLIQANLMTNDPGSERLQLINKSEFLVREINEIEVEDANLGVPAAGSNTFPGAFYEPLADNTSPEKGMVDLLMSTTANICNLGSDL